MSVSTPFDRLDPRLREVAQGVVSEAIGAAFVSGDVTLGPELLNDIIESVEGAVYEASGDIGVSVTPVLVKDMPAIVKECMKRDGRLSVNFLDDDNAGNDLLSLEI